MKTYRIDTFGNLDNLRPHEELLPKLGRGEVLVRVRATALNFRDLMIMRGEGPPNATEGSIPNSDGAGEIEAVGEGVTRFDVGDRVTSTFFPNWFGGRPPIQREQYMIEHDGWLTEYKMINAEFLTLMPDHLTFEEAATLSCAGVTAWSALAGVKAGDTVLTLGTGGVSIFAVQLAKALGARVIATTPTDTTLDRLRAIGADEIINYETTPDWDRAVRDLTGGVGVDRVVEVGGPTTIARSIKSVAQGGQVSLVGMLGGMQGDPLSIMDLFASQAVYKPVAVGSRSDLEDLNRVVSGQTLHPVIDSVFDFADARAAYDHFAGRNVFGKVVIKM